MNEKNIDTEQWNVYNIHLMYGPDGNSYFCCPESSDISQDKVEGDIRIRVKTKLTSFPKYHTLSALLCIKALIPLNNHKL